MGNRKQKSSNIRESKTSRIGSDVPKLRDAESNSNHQTRTQTHLQQKTTDKKNSRKISNKQIQWEKGEFDYPKNDPPKLRYSARPKNKTNPNTAGKTGYESSDDSSGSDSNSNTRKKTTKHFYSSDEEDFVTQTLAKKKDTEQRFGTLNTQGSKLDLAVRAANQYELDQMAIQEAGNLKLSHRAIVQQLQKRKVGELRGKMPKEAAKRAQKQKEIEIDEGYESGDEHVRVKKDLHMTNFVISDPEARDKPFYGSFIETGSKNMAFLSKKRPSSVSVEQLSSEESGMRPSMTVEVEGQKFKNMHLVSGRPKSAKTILKRTSQKESNKGSIMMMDANINKNKNTDMELENHNMYTGKKASQKSGGRLDYVALPKSGNYNVSQTVTHMPDSSSAKNKPDHKMVIATVSQSSSSTNSNTSKTSAPKLNSRKRQKAHHSKNES